MTQTADERKELLILGQQIRRLDPARKAKEVEHNRKYRRRKAYRKMYPEFLPRCTCAYCLDHRLAYDAITGKK